MQWLNKVVDDVLAKYPDGDLIVSSGVSPSGKYHLGTLREVLTADVIAAELRRRGRQAKHVHVVDDLDVFRKVPAGLPESYSQYLGRPLCDIPAPDDQAASYADYYLNDLLAAADKLNLEMEVFRSHQNYRAGYFVPAIEKALGNVARIRDILESVSGRKLDKNWSPIQVIEDGYLKNREFVRLNTDDKTLVYRDATGQEHSVSYANGLVKLNWRVDWPARWWLLPVQVEPFGRDHATKGGSYDTGAVIVKDIFDSPAPYPLAYNFINRTGDTKKMSKSAGETVTLEQLLQLMPAEIVRYFILRYSPDKLLFFDDGVGMVRLFDEFGVLLAKADKSPEEQQLIEISFGGEPVHTVSSVPFSHLVASYQAALKDESQTIEVIKRTEHAQAVTREEQVIKNELKFIDNWLATKAPEEVKFSIEESIEHSLQQYELSDAQKHFLTGLADKVQSAPADADGEWFHKAIYAFKDQDGLAPKDLFTALYRVLITKDYGPRAGWFLATLYQIRGQDWLVKRLKLEA